jgi:serine/threonine protein kinase
MPKGVNKRIGVDNRVGVDKKDIIGKGSYGEVTIRDGKAVKKFSKLSHLIQEYTALKYLNDCQYIVKDAGANFAKLELYMDLYDCSLRNWLEDNEKADKHDLMKITHDIIYGLVELHDRCLSHADLKPGNILVRKHPLGVVLGDCGFVSIAKYAKVDRTAAIYRDINIEFTQKHDIFSLGICLLEIHGNIRLNRQPKTYNELKDVIENKIHDPLLNKIIYNCLREDKTGRPTAKTLLYRLFHEKPTSWLKPDLIPINDSYTISRDHRLHIRATMKEASSQFGIYRTKKGFGAILSYLETHTIESDKYALFSAVTLMILSALFGSSGFNERAVIELCEHKYHTTTVHNILNDLLCDRLFIGMLLYPDK